MRMFFRKLVLAALLAAIPAGAQAHWRKASSEHFVIYADDSERDLQQFGETLERYHAAMAYLTKSDQAAPSPSNRVTIYVVGSERDVQKLAGGDSKYVGGFYIPRAGGSRAFVQKIRSMGRDPDFSVIILLHEYAHHFLMSSSRFALPRWMNEGAAEFYASADFPRDGSVNIGKPAQHRGPELYRAREVSIEELFDPELYEKKRKKGYDAFYGRSWLLYHYLTFNEERRGQFAAYLTALLDGKAPLEAARAGFGDLDQLEDELDDYLGSSKMMQISLPAEWLKIRPVTVSELSEGMDEMIEVQMRSQRGVNREQALAIVEDARRIAAKYPDDPSVLAELAEAEYDAGNPDAAIAAADRAIALDPALTNPYVQKGYALFAEASEAGADADWAAALKPWTALNQLENDHPLPLIYFYRIAQMRGGEVPELARGALEWASQLAPFDLGLTFQTALMQAGEGKIALAQANLLSVASNPHGGGLAEKARQLHEALAGFEEGTPVGPADLPTLVSPPEGDDPES
ncbi:hypothetical protein MKP08_06045 [Erythrobacter sp. LQ02-29]|uniref:hypothetical protein n=1 Tax=Erythrobacter sp. LQ02-29 TaxID=2920384 RepID=UPI001F4DB3D1|nr:hypothetical protein [Erythrobacter sp. LQ02-29]MCP9222307.1 hypothetical protein [Erythrobacter sp. LQ02-29]